MIVKYPTDAPVKTEIHFQFKCSDLYEAIKEQCQRMVRLAVDGERPAVKDYAVNDETPTVAARQRFIDGVCDRIVLIIRKLTDEPVFKIGYNKIYSTDDDAFIDIPIRNCESFNDADINAMDTSMRDMLIYGFLTQWFATVNAPAVHRDDAKRSYDDAGGHLAASARGVIQELNRRIPSNPFGI